MKLNFSFIFFLFVSTIFSLCGQNIKGKTIYSYCKEDIPFAQISLIKGTTIIANTTSDIDGEFVFKNIEFGEYKLFSKYEGCVMDTLKTIINEKKDYNVKIEFNCLSITCYEGIELYNNNYINLDSIIIRQYIEKLRIKNKDHNTSYEINIDKKAKIDWIKKDDVEYLMTLISSTERAKCVWQDISSKLPKPDQSTIGGQAMNLIDCFRLGVTYPNFLTDCSDTNSKRVSEIEKWWNDLK